MEWGSWHCTGDRDQDHPHGKEMQKVASVLSNSLWSLLCPWYSSGKNNGVGCLVLLQGIFLEGILLQGLNLVLLLVLHWQAGSLLLVPAGEPQKRVNGLILERINLSRVSQFQRCTLRYLCHTFSSILYHLRLLFPCFNITLALFHWKKWNHWEENLYLHLPPKLSNLSESVFCLPSYDKWITVFSLSYGKNIHLWFVSLPFFIITSELISAFYFLY